MKFETSGGLIYLHKISRGINEIKTNFFYFKNDIY